MNQAGHITRTSRKLLAQFIENYTLEQLNKIPEGFNNNLIWNIAHNIVVQQMLVYNLSGQPMMLPAEMINRYKKGTKPEQDVTQAEVDEIKSLLFSTIEKTEEDYEAKLFENFQEYPTSTGFVLKSVEDALAFNYFHEALHLGVIMSIRKFI